MAEAQEEQHRRVEVLKYQFHAALGRPQSFSMPMDSSFLTLQLQNEIPTVWWLCAVFVTEFVQRTFVTLTDGPPGTDVPLYYVGTYQLGSFVGHVFCTTPFNREAALVPQ